MYFFSSIISHDRDGIWISDVNSHRFLVSIKKIYQTHETVFHHISKYLKALQNILAYFSTLFPVSGNVVKHGLS